MSQGEGATRSSRRTEFAVFFGVLLGPSVLGLVLVGVAFVAHVRWLAFLGAAFVATVLLRKRVTLPLLTAWLRRRGDDTG